MLSVLFTATHSFAQAPKSPQDRAFAQIQWMKANIALTTDQTQKVFPILMKYSQQVDNIPSGTDKVTATQTIQGKSNLEVKPLLSADQFSKYQTYEVSMTGKIW